MAKAWHYAWAGKSEGPVDELVIRDLIRAGRVKADTLVWSGGMANWDRADRHFAFAPQPLAPAAPPAGPPAMPGAAYPGAGYPGAGSHGAGASGAAPARSFIEAIKVCFQKYVTFRGRASRSEYWWFFLFCLLLGFVGGILETTMGRDGAVLSGLVSLATFLPSLSVTVRRLHDTDRSGWWVGGFYLALIPAGLMIGLLGVATQAAGGTPEAAALAVFGLMSLLSLAYMIAMFVFMCSRGTPGPNRFG
ncbi:DUF805 domain-containing protein [Rhodobacter capsulatus]|uniref:DUF805 domain-containing protein n=1 Tax=Rhodobacter capsulatus TaxID=1061 RepID=UPI000A7D5F34|nr:DUF805 domain-containing protein [Rhodobacter capsulatus]PZX24237.1 uncharacterized membrane protein YhaH (DUF805 family) [Rhodobacter capsulatus]QNR63785.1 DUF805 domain-containing protein [Rhodobacter capsulatus]